MMLPMPSVPAMRMSRAADAVFDREHVVGLECEIRLAVVAKDDLAAELRV